MARSHKWKQDGLDLTDQPVEYEYMTDRMSVMDQHETVRRLAPPLVGSLEDLTAANPDDPNALRKIVAKILAGLGSLPKEDHDWVLNALLSRVKRRKASEQTSAFANIWSNHGFMFDDIQLADMYSIIREAGVFTFGNFMQMVQAIRLG